MDNFSKILFDVESLSVDAEGVAGPSPSDACSLRGRSHVTAAAEPCLATPPRGGQSTAAQAQQNLSFSNLKNEK